MFFSDMQWCCQTHRAQTRIVSCVLHHLIAVYSNQQKNFFTQYWPIKIRLQSFTFWAVMDDYMHIYVCLLMCEQKLKQKLTCLRQGLVQEGQHVNLHLEVEIKSLLVFLTSCLEGYFISHLINIQCVVCFLQVPSWAGATWHLGNECRPLCQSTDLTLNMQTYFYLMMADTKTALRARRRCREDTCKLNTDMKWEQTQDLFTVNQTAILQHVFYYFW